MSIKVGNRIIISKARINLDLFPPAIEGMDDVPDLKAWLNKALVKQVVEASFDPKTFFAHQMQEYNKRLDEVNSKLPKLYGEILRDMHKLISGQSYEEVVKLGDMVLEVFPESEEAKMLREKSLYALGKHPLLLLYAEIMATSDKPRRKKLLDEFWEKAIKCCVFVVENILCIAADLYRKSEKWEDRHFALDIIKAIRFIELSEEATEKLDGLLLDALRDDDGRVRNNAFHCVSHLRGMNIPVDFFFKIFKTAKQEENRAKLHNLCRALLDFVCPGTDDAMKEFGKWNEYHKAIDFALGITQYDPAYYKANSVEKVKLHWGDWRIKSRRLNKEKSI